MTDAPPALAFLIGAWSGTGHGEYPTIESFDYQERVQFWHTGKPFLWYAQRTSALDDGRPLHAESGFVRAPGPGRIELVIAHPTGIAEVAEGSLDATTIRVASTTLATTATAKEVAAVERDIEVDGPTLTYAVRMAVEGQPLTHHLAATLRRES